MGQAKNRGTRDQRVEQAKIRREIEEQAEQVRIAELAKELAEIKRQKAEQAAANPGAVVLVEDRHPISRSMALAALLGAGLALAPRSKK